MEPGLGLTAGGHTSDRAVPDARRGVAAAAVLVLFSGLMLFVWAMPASGLPTPAVAEQPFAAFQYGTAGCIEVGVRPAAPFNQLPPYQVPDSYNRIAQGYPTGGYDPAALGFTAQSGTNSCLYNFYDKNRKVDPAAVVIGTGYCIQFGAGQLSGTGYDPEPATPTSIANFGYVLRILQDYYPLTTLPAGAATTNAQKAGTVAMAIHFFTDGIVMPPTYQTAGLYNVVAGIVADAIAKGPLPTVPTDPSPTITGPDSGVTGTLAGPYTFGPSGLASPITVTVDGAQAFTDAAGTQPFTNGSALAAGAQLWLRSATDSTFTIKATASRLDPTGTLMVGDTAVARVQSMLLTKPITLLGKVGFTGTFAAAPVEATLASQVSSHLIEVGGSVADTYAVGGLGVAEPATIQVILYGPVSPVGGDGCVGVNWTPVSSLPVTRRFAPIAVVGDGPIDIDPTQLTEPGCYSYGALIAPAAGPQVTAAPGDPTETVRVLPRPVVPPWQVRSAASAQQVEPGDSVSDRITLTGMLPGRTMTLASALYGPLAPAADGTCTSINWLSARPPVAARFAPLVLASNGTTQTPPVHLTRIGCYTFATAATNNFVTGGEVPTDQGFGNPAEIVEVTAPPPPPAPTQSTFPPSVLPETPSAQPVDFNPELAATGTAASSVLAIGIALTVAGAALTTMVSRRARP
ncbi:hypothetical protein ACSMXN_23285 [Jatrophihabitans sp. DSM 45814]